MREPKTPPGIFSCKPICGKLVPPGSPHPTVQPRRDAEHKVSEAAAPRVPHSGRVTPQAGSEGLALRSLGLRHLLPGKGASAAHWGPGKQCSCARGPPSPSLACHQWGGCHVGHRSPLTARSDTHSNADIHFAARKCPILHVFLNTTLFCILYKYKSSYLFSKERAMIAHGESTLKVFLPTTNG